MLFDSHYWLTAILFAVFSGALTYLLSCLTKRTSRSDSDYGYSRSRRDEQPKEKGFFFHSKGAVTAAVIVFVFDLLVQRINMYYGQPALTGSFLGYFSQVFCALAPAIGVGIFMSRGRAILFSVPLVLVLFGWPLAQTLMFSAGPSNAHAFAELPHVTTAKADETIPPTDEQHLVQVTESMAELKAKTVLSSKGNYSTRFAIGNLTLQSIRGHRFYAAPLIPTNNNDTFWTPLFGGRAQSPGYVLVDAEDKEANPVLHDEFHISLFEDMPFSMSLNRYVYQSGFNKGSLDDATFEVDDNYQPHWTITYVTPAFGNIVGSKLSKVLVVSFDEDGEPTVNAYKPGDAQIKWVDRVISAKLVREYAHDWGVYGQAFSNTSFGAWFEVWAGISKQDTMVPVDGDDGLMFSYTKNDHNIWVVPMTSQNSTDHGVLGVLVFETDINKATYYPGLHGFNHGGSVSQTMFGAKDNGFQKYDVGNLELYNIYGHLTWVAVYTKQQSNGATFGAIGFMDAHSQQVSDVAYGSDLQSALSDYANKLAQGSNGMAATQANEKLKIDGNIWRIAPNGAVWRFQIVGDDSHYFDVSTQTYPGTPLLRDGDHVVGSYMDTHQVQSAVSDLKLVGNGAGNKAGNK